jgi:hypothetical protein
MSFDAQAAIAARAIFEKLGVAAVYDNHLMLKGTLVVIDRNVVPFPESFDSRVSERQTEISLLVEDVPVTEHGHTLLADGTLYRVADQLFNDGTVIRVAVKK